MRKLVGGKRIGSSKKPIMVLLAKSTVYSEAQA
jgi:hypothetical protein